MSVNWVGGEKGVTGALEGDPLEFSFLDPATWHSHTLYPLIYPSPKAPGPEGFGVKYREELPLRGG